MQVMATTAAIERSGTHDFLQLGRMLLMVSTRGVGLRGDVPDQIPGLSPRVARLLKSPVDFSDFGALTGEFRTVAESFVESLRNFGVFDRMLQDGGIRRVPLRARVAVTTLGATGDEVEMGKPKPVSSLVIAPGSLPLRKSAAIVVASAELLDAAASPAAASLFARELSVASASSVDRVFLNAIIDSNVGSVSGSNDFGATLGAMTQALEVSGPQSKYYLICSPDVAQWAAGLQGENGPKYPNLSPAGGTIGSWLTVLVSDQFDEGGVMLLVDADGIAGDTEPPILDAARHTSLDMVDSPSAGAANHVSMWQTGSRALRSERVYAFEVLRPQGIVLATGVGPGS